MKIQWFLYVGVYYTVFNSVHGTHWIWQPWKDIWWSYNRLSKEDKRQIYARFFLGGGNHQGILQRLPTP
jgi:hypothetical protein